MDKFGSYIQKLMATIVDKNQEEFVINLAIDDLKRLNKDITEFILKNSMDVENKKTSKKQLLQENGKDV